MREVSTTLANWHLTDSNRAFTGLLGFLVIANWKATVLLETAVESKRVEP